MGFLRASHSFCSTICIPRKRWKLAGLKTFSGSTIVLLQIVRLHELQLIVNEEFKKCRLDLISPAGLTRRG